MAGAHQGITDSKMTAIPPQRVEFADDGTLTTSAAANAACGGLSHEEGRQRRNPLGDSLAIRFPGVAASLGAPTERMALMTARTMENEISIDEVKKQEALLAYLQLARADERGLHGQTSHQQARHSLSRRALIPPRTSMSQRTMLPPTYQSLFPRISASFQYPPTSGLRATAPSGRVLVFPEAISPAAGALPGAGTRPSIASVQGARDLSGYSQEGNSGLAHLLRLGDNNPGAASAGIPSHTPDSCLSLSQALALNNVIDSTTRHASLSPFMVRDIIAKADEMSQLCFETMAMNELARRGNAAAVPQLGSQISQAGQGRFHEHSASQQDQSPAPNGNPEGLQQKPPKSLASEEDENWLSEYLCFVRRDLLEVIVAQPEDEFPSNIASGQVGIRCRFCNHLPLKSRVKRSFSFPSATNKLYQSIGAMLTVHFPACEAIPKDVINKFWALKSETTQGAIRSVDYWSDSAKKLGLVDTPKGIFFQKEMAPETELARGSAQAASKPQNSLVPRRIAGEPLVTLEDKGHISDFYYDLMVQTERVEMTESDRRVAGRKYWLLGLPGFACRHCCRQERAGMSRFFPRDKRSLPQKVNNFYYHIQRCTLVSGETKLYLAGLREKESLDASLPFVREREKQFYERIWHRLGLHMNAAPSSW